MLSQQQTQEGLDEAILQWETWKYRPIWFCGLPFKSLGIPGIASTIPQAED